MPKRDFNKVATLLKSHLGVGILHIFRTHFLKNTSEELILNLPGTQVYLTVSLALQKKILSSVLSHESVVLKKSSLPRIFVHCSSLQFNLIRAIVLLIGK